MSKNLVFETDNFNLSEFATNPEGVIIPNPNKPQLVYGLELLKEEIAKRYGYPINKTYMIVTSGDRPGDDGYHGTGLACDIWTRFADGKVLTSIEQMRIVEDMEIFTGRGLYPEDHGFIHVDVRRGLYPQESGNRISRWYRKYVWNENIQDYQQVYKVWNKDYKNYPFDGYLN